LEIKVTIDVYDSEYMNDYEFFIYFIRIRDTFTYKISESFRIFRNIRFRIFRILNLKKGVKYG